ncbi:hypothetical protein GCM10027447_35290 [Glycomyces halotolerans]
MAQGKGFDYYRNTYTHEQLWDMLFTDADPWSVEQAGSLWSTAKGGLERAREELETNVLDLRNEWTGTAAAEFQGRMSKVIEYSIATEDALGNAADRRIPSIATALETAQSSARDEDLYPRPEHEDYQVWLEEVKGMEYGTPEEEKDRTKLKREHGQYLSDRHDSMARVIATLGDEYAAQREDLEDPPLPPPSGMPGNNSYQPPTGGVFGNDGLNSGGSAPGAPGGVAGGVAGGGAMSYTSDGLNGADPDDLEPVDGWTPGSYDDVDSPIHGGLAGSTGLVTTPSGSLGGSMTTSGVGGSSLASTGGGLFGPGKTGGGTGSTAGRGTGTGNNSPARSGAKSGSSSTRGSGSNSSGRGGNSGRGMSNRGTGPRGGTRSGYYDDDEDEETTRETWLREDDVDWGRSRVSEDEIDD